MHSARKQKGSVTILVLVLILIVFSIGLILYLQIYSKSSNLITLPTPTNTIHEKTSIQEPPPLYPKLNWKEGDISKLEEKSGMRKVYFGKSTKEGYEGATESGRINGKIWYGETKVSSKEEDNFYYDFINYYDTELTKRGWKWQVDANGVKISGLSADRPGGTVKGYIQLNNGKIRTFVIGIGGYLENHNQQPNSYPIIYRYSVFVSDFVPITDIISN